MEKKEKMSRRRLLDRAKYAVPVVATLAMTRKSRSQIIISGQPGTP
jgi:hypothetical protein